MLMDYSYRLNNLHFLFVYLHHLHSYLSMNPKSLSTKNQQVDML